MKKFYFAIIAIFCLSLPACGREGLILSEFPDEISMQDTTEEKNENAADASYFDAKNKGFVHICGAVENEGIYEFSEGERLFELIEKAGGFDEEADRAAVNLATKVKDGEQIRIPFIGEELSIEDEKLININEADIGKLCEIPGIGEKRAADIINYREENGGFKEIEELKNVTGIKDATFNKIKPYVCVK